MRRNIRGIFSSARKKKLRSFKTFLYQRDETQEPKINQRSLREWQTEDNEITKARENMRCVSGADITEIQFIHTWCVHNGLISNYWSKTFNKKCRFIFFASCRIRVPCMWQNGNNTRLPTPFYSMIPAIICIELKRRKHICLSSFALRLTLALLLPKKSTKNWDRLLVQALSCLVESCGTNVSKFVVKCQHSSLKIWYEMSKDVTYAREPLQSGSTLWNDAFLDGYGCVRRNL